MYNNYNPTRKYDPIESVINDKLDKNSILSYLYCMLLDDRQNITKSQEISTFNEFATSGIQMILNKIFNIDKTIALDDAKKAETGIEAVRIQITFLSVTLDTPKLVDKSGLYVPRNPDDYRANNGFYAADIITDILFKLTATKPHGQTDVKEHTLHRVRISSVPIMVKSRNCNTYNMSDITLKQVNEDPNDPGGYFIVNGGERVLVGTDNIAFNKPLIIKSNNKNDRVQATIISQGGGMFGNSTNMVFKLTNNYSIILEIQTFIYENLQVPFYMIYKMFGKTSDREIYEMIVYDHQQSTEETDKMTEIILTAFRNKYAVGDKKTSSEMISAVNNITTYYDNVTSVDDPTAYKKDDETVRSVVDDMLNKLDRSILPHIGTDPSHRYSKLLHISMIIRDMIMVDMGTRPPDDRDHCANKRVHGSGITLSKSFKTLFNTYVIRPMLSTIKTEVETKTFDTINIADLALNLKNKVSGKDLEQSFTKHILESDKNSTRTKEKIRMNAQTLERKNVLNVILTLRTIVAILTSVAKSTRRSDAIRFWHPSYEGLIAPFHTPEGGDKVGTTKQLALSAIVTNHQYTDEVKAFVKNDPDSIDPNNILPIDIANKFLAKVYVDGDWVACVSNPKTFATRYRLLRREGVIDRFVSIEWNTISNVIYIYADMGRLVRPLLIVDNNLDDFNAGKTDKFVQNIRLSDADIIDIRSRRLTFEEMIKRGYIEYIYPGEEVLLCPSVEQLREDRHNYVQRWTHCDIPQTLFSPATLTGPYLDRNQAFRNIMVQIHAKQACGQPFTNPMTTTKRSQRFHMNQVDVPLVKTVSKDLFPPNSQNGMVLYSVFHGHNQEDSSILNRAAVERGFLRGIYFKEEVVMIDKSQTIRVPKERETQHMRTRPYGKLGENGIVPVGTILRKGDIMVGRVTELANPTEDGKKYFDKSVPYEFDEDGRVVSVLSNLTGEDKFVRLTFEFIRPIVNGDKCSSRAGNKNIVSSLVPSSDLPYVKSTGIRPNQILNPHSVPTRETLAQMFESTISKLAAKRGAFVDGTVYSRFDVYELLKELVSEGLAINETMINGATGEEFQATLFMGPQTTIRLPKFVKEDRHAVGTQGPRNQITGQALTGKKAGGGSKAGEMELWVMLAQGATSILHEEFFMHSDMFKVHVCRNCNTYAIYNEVRGIYACNTKTCLKPDICAIDSSKTSLLFNHELQTANIAMKLIPEPRKYEQYAD